MRKFLFTSLMMLSVALLALAGCSNSGNPPPVIHIQQNNNAPSSPGSPASPAATGFLVPSALESSIAHEQYQFLSAAPASDYDSTDNAAITISCQSTGTDTFTCTGSDSDGDVGSSDNVTVAANGSSWSDSGMNWSGPDVSPSGGGGFTVAPVSNWTGS
jgi:hypothetical protein